MHSDSTALDQRLVTLSASISNAKVRLQRMEIAPNVIDQAIDRANVASEELSKIFDAQCGV